MSMYMDNVHYRQIICTVKTVYIAVLLFSSWPIVFSYLNSFVRVTGLVVNFYHYKLGT